MLCVKRCFTGRSIQHFPIRCQPWILTRSFSKDISTREDQIRDIVKQHSLMHVVSHGGGETLPPNALLHYYIKGELINGYKIIQGDNCIQHFWVEKNGKIYDASSSDLDLQEKDPDLKPLFDQLKVEISKTPRGNPVDIMFQPEIHKQQKEGYQLYHKNAESYFNSLDQKWNEFLDNVRRDVNKMS